MTIAITGGTGFLGWHTAVRLRAEHGVHAKVLGRADFTDIAVLTEALRHVDTVIHLAGINRAESDEAVETGNIRIGGMLARELAAGPARHVVYGNSIQSRADSAYGRGKARASQLLQAAVAKSGGTFADVMLPNLFGEHGRPHYNSFVATFCHEIVRDGSPKVFDDKEVPLLHAQAAASHLIGAARRRENQAYVPEAEQHLVSEVLDGIRGYHELYVKGQVPSLADAFDVELFNTYRSYMFPRHFPFRVDIKADERGTLFEAVRAHGGTGQTFVSTTQPGSTRGDHYHLSKIERFMVICGSAEIALRRICDDEVVRFRVDGNAPSFIDMPTMWAHNIRNVGHDELITLFWADQLHDPAFPDTYREPVDRKGGQR